MDAALAEGSGRVCRADEPRLDFVFTVCDDAAGETCPIWPGHPMTAHWGIEDPAKVEGAGRSEAFRPALGCLDSRISLFLALPLGSVGEMTLQGRLLETGGTGDSEPAIA